MNSAINELVRRIGAQKETAAQQAERELREEFTRRATCLMELLGDAWAEISSHAELRIERYGRTSYPVYTVKLPEYTPFEIRLNLKDSATLGYRDRHDRDIPLPFLPEALAEPHELPATAVRRILAEFLWRDQERLREQREEERASRFRGLLGRLRADQGGYLDYDIAAQTVAQARELAPEAEEVISATYVEWQQRRRRADQEITARREREAAERAARERKNRRWQVALDRHEASHEARFQAEERNAERLAPLQAELDGPFTAYELTYSAIGRSDEDGEETFLETQTVLCLSDEPGDRGYYRTVRRGQISEERFAYPVRIERIAQARWSERSEAAQLAVPEAGYNFRLSFSPELDRDAVKARVAAYGLEPLPELLPHPDRFDFDTEEFDA